MEIIGNARGAALLGTLLLCGCVPWPHFEQRAPRISGTVTRGGAPAGDVRVLFYPRCDAGRMAAACEGSRRETRTDGRGQFSFDAERDFSLFVTLGDRINCWEVCVEQGGAVLPGAKVVDLGPPRASQLQCELDDSQAGGAQGGGVCTCSTCRRGRPKP